MSHGLKLLLIAVGAIITCIIIVVGFQVSKSGRSDSDKASEQYRELSSNINNFLDYDGRAISGQEVIDLIYDNQSLDICFVVKTNLCEALLGVYYNRDEDFSVVGTYDKNNVSKTSSDYINENSLFECSVTKNKNGIVIGLRFVQKG